MTLQEFDQLPDTPGFEELLDGVVIRVPPAKVYCSEIAHAIFFELLDRVDPDTIRIYCGFVIDTHCLEPDVAVLHAKHGLELGWLSGAPLVAVQVASRGDSAEVLARKTDAYLSGGSQEVWEVYWTTRSVLLHTKDGVTRYRGNMFSRALGLTFDVAEWFK